MDLRQAAGVVAYSLAVTEIAAADPAVSVTMCVNNMVAEVLQAFGTDEQRQRWIPPLVGGTFTSGSFCLSEAGAGSDPQGMRTRAVRGDGGWILDGTKAWITSGAHAGVFIVWARTDDRISTFVVDPRTDGISFGKPEEKTGQHASNTVTLGFDDVHLPDDALLGDVGRGFPVAMMALDGGRVGIASQSLGIGRAVLTELRSFGVEDAALADIEAEWTAARLLVLRAASMKERAEPFSREASMAKLYASEQCGRACDAAFRLLGAHAFRQPSFLDKLARDARVTRMTDVTGVDFVDTSGVAAVTRTRTGSEVAPATSALPT